MPHLDYGESSRASASRKEVQDAGELNVMYVLSAGQEEGWHMVNGRRPEYNLTSIEASA